MKRRRQEARRKRPADRYQLSFPLSWLSEKDFIEALRARGVSGIRRIRYKPNRTRLISLSQDRRALNIHDCFRAATDDVLDAVAGFLLLPNGSAAQRRSIERMRAWSEGQADPEAGRTTGRNGAARTAGSPLQIAFLEATYERLNRERFGGHLPDHVPIRLSDRMSHGFGHVQYGRTRGGVRSIDEIALTSDLLIEGNERHLLDTLLHEMAHIEAWMLHGHRGHGEPWRRIAERVGCEVFASSLVRIRRRRNGAAPLGHAREVDAFLRAASARRRTRSNIAQRQSRPASRARRGQARRRPHAIN
jgi:hypothetical protein